MAHKKHQQKHDSKKQTPATSQQVDNIQVEQQLAHYQDIAQALRSSSYGDIEPVLEPIITLDEGTQVAFLKALSKEPTIDAADVLAAVNTFAPSKEARKEARRSLIRLQEVRIYPQWTPPSAPSFSQAIEELFTAGPRRFWKGVYTNSRDIGEIHLSLFWEQGDHFREVRVANFLLEFWHDGVKDFFTQVVNKRQAERRLEEMRMHFSEMGLVNCTLPQARLLIEEALEANRKFGTKPHSDYTRNLPLIRELILDNPEASGEAVVVDEEDENNKALVLPDLDEDEEDDEDDEDDSAPDFPDLLSALEEMLGSTQTEAARTVIDFLESWTDGDYEVAYDYLTDDSPLRENLSQEDWVDWRARWDKEAKPHAWRLGTVVERTKDTEDEATEQAQSIVDAFWSLAYHDTPPGNAPAELPFTTAFLEETGRHWFWTSYTLVPDAEADGDLSIHTMTDEGANTLRLSTDELKSRIAEIVQIVEQRAQEEEKLAQQVEEEENNEEEDEQEGGILNETLQESVQRISETYKITSEALHYNDALIYHAPQDDPEVYWQAYRQAVSLDDAQRAIVYLKLLADRFPEHRSEALGLLATVYLKLSSDLRDEIEELDEYEDLHDDEDEDLDEDEDEDFDDDEDPEILEKQAQRFDELAEKALRDAIAVDPSPTHLLNLATLLIALDKNLDEAEEFLHQAQVDITDPEKIKLIEKGLGDIARHRDDKEQALSHYQRVAELQPDFSGIWAVMGSLQYQLGRSDQAIVSLQRSIEQEPDLSHAYAGLGAIYAERHDLAKAREILKEGLERLPEAPELLAPLSLVYLEGGDLRTAQRYLEEAEDIDDSLPIVQIARRTFNEKKSERRGLIGKMKLPKKKR